MALSLCVSLLLAAPASAGAPAPLLLLGNSYTQAGSLDRLVVELARETMGADHLAGSRRLAAGGLRLPDHLARVEGDDPAWVDAFAAPGAWGTVLLQDQSQIPGLPMTDPYWLESAAAAVALDERAAGLGAETMLFITWGRRDGDTTLPDLYPDFETMNDRLEAGYRAYADGVTDRAVRFAPVNRAFAHVLAAHGPDAGLPFHRLYASDGSHPSELGSALAAGVIFAAATGWEPRWLDGPPGGTVEDRDWMVAAVRAAVSPTDELPDAWVALAAEHVPPLDVELPADTVVVSGVGHCQTLTDAGGAVEPGVDMRIGVAHRDGGGGCGRVGLSGGSLTLGALGLAESGQQAHLLVDDGDLAVEALTVGGAGWGRVLQTGGSATVGQLDVVDGEVVVADGSLDLGGATGPLIQRGGSIALAAGATFGGLHQEQGTLHLALAADAPAARFTEAVQLAGRLEVDGLDAAVGAQVLIEAGALGLDAGAEVMLPAGWTVTLEEGRRLVAHPDTVAPADDGGGTGDDGTTPEAVDTAPPAGTAGTVRVAPPESDDGCAGGRLGMLLGSGLLLGLGRRRRGTGPQ